MPQKREDSKIETQNYAPIRRKMYRPVNGCRLENQTSRDLCMYMHRSRIPAMHPSCHLVSSRVYEVPRKRIPDVHDPCELGASFPHERDPRGRNYFANESVLAPGEVIGIHVKISRIEKHAFALITAV